MHMLYINSTKFLALCTSKMRMTPIAFHKCVMPPNAFVKCVATLAGGKTTPSILVDSSGNYSNKYHNPSPYSRHNTSMPTVLCVGVGGYALLSCMGGSTSFNFYSAYGN